MFYKKFLILFILIFFVYGCSKSNEEPVVETEVVEIAPLTKYRVTSRQLRIRRGPGTRFEEMQSIPHNTQVVFIDKVETKDAGVWFLIQTIPDNDLPKIEGFVYSLHLEKVASEE